MRKPARCRTQRAIILFKMDTLYNFSHRGSLFSGKIIHFIHFYTTAYFSFLHEQLVVFIVLILLQLTRSVTAFNLWFTLQKSIENLLIFTHRGLRLCTFFNKLYKMDFYPVMYFCKKFGCLCAKIHKVYTHSRFFLFLLF